MWMLVAILVGLTGVAVAEEAPPILEAEKNQVSCADDAVLVTKPGEEPTKHPKVTVDGNIVRCAGEYLVFEVTEEPIPEAK